MICKNCDSEIPENVKVCPVCGAETEFSEEATDVENTVEIPACTEDLNPEEDKKLSEKEQKEEGFEKNNKKRISLVAVILAIVLAIGGIAAGIYFGTDWFATGDGKCGICEKNISKRRDYCKECIKSHKCKECGKFDEKAVDGYCSQHRKCRNCKESIKKGYYCEKCIDRLTGDNFELACIHCYIEYRTTIPRKRPNDYRNFWLKNRLANEDIFFIDKNGNCYCRDCESTKKCEKCDGYLSEDDDDNVCWDCARSLYGTVYEQLKLSYCNSCMTEVVDAKTGACDKCKNSPECIKCGEKTTWLETEKGICINCADADCYSCYKLLDESEISYSFVNRFDYKLTYCSECDTGNYCTKCKTPLLEKNDDDNVCYECTDYSCYICYEVLEESEEAHSYVDGEEKRYYCKECYTGKKCEGCDKMLKKYDDDKVCYECAAYYCCECHEVLGKNEKAHTHKKKDYCKKCYTGKHCEECGFMLTEDDDDTVCLPCADYGCIGCMEVLEKSEAAYVGTGKIGFTNIQACYCKECYTGKHCENCDRMIGKDDDDSVCSFCADYACYKCREVLEKSEIAYTYTDEKEQYYCSKCYTGKYCSECGIMLEKDTDDSVCSSCAEFICYKCGDVLGSLEISHTEIFHIDFQADEVKAVYCKACDTGKYCTDCNMMLNEYDDDDVCESCAEIKCNRCSEVMESSEISYAYYHGDGTKRVYCEDCDTGKYCTECDRMLEKEEDDDTCESCAKIKCYDCSEVLGESEISHIYYDLEYNEKKYFCKKCDTGKHCSECGEMLEKDDDDEVCYECADYKCENCYEALKKMDISYVYRGAEEQYYCKKCDTGKYCEDCGRVIDEQCWYCS